MKILYSMGIAVAVLILAASHAAGESVLTYHNDNARTGANTNESQLTLANVNTNSFGLLLKYPVDAYVYGQPLFVPGVEIPGKGKHDVVYVVTENDSVYAFDANSNTGADAGQLWHASLGEGVDVVTNHEFGNRYHNGVLQDMLPRVGITSTPVIDPASGTIYALALTRVATSASTNFYQRLHALDVATGEEKSGSPVLVKATYPGTGMDSSNGVVTFMARQQNQRCALTLAGGVLYIAYASYADTDPYHGWIIGFNAATLQPLTNYVFNVTPNATTAVFGPEAGEGGLWMSGGGLCVDDHTNLFFETANGSFDADTGGGDYGDSFMKLSTSNGLAVLDYFTPYNQAALQAGDVDLGSGGPVLLPDDVGSAAHPHLIVGAGKESKIYLIDRDQMGHYNTKDDSQIVQSFQANDGRCFSTPAYFNHTIYNQGINGVLRAYAISNGLINTTPTSETMTSFSGFGTTPSVSANGLDNAIAWTIQSDAAVEGGPAILHAYNATNLAVELYNSSQLPARDNPGNAVKMTVPTVANGKVFIGAQYAVAIFGNGIFLPTPAISPKGGGFTGSVAVTLSEAAPDASIYYTLDGTTPKSASTLYTAPLSLTNTANLKAIAIKTGTVNSLVASASFNNTSAAGHGTGLLGSYWTSPGFDTPPTLTRTDSVVNFDWSAGPPVSPVNQSGFTAHWEGSVRAQSSDTYHLITVTRGGTRLWLNGQLLIDDWTAHPSSTTNSIEITLRSQQLYTLRLDAFQTAGAAAAQLFWSSPTISQEIIPQSQLYPATNPPPTVTLVRPPKNATYEGTASLTIGAQAEAEDNAIAKVDFYANGNPLGTLTNSIYAPVYAMTQTGLHPGDYTLTAIATDGSGLVSTSAPVTITVTPGSGLPYGLADRAIVPAFLNLPPDYTAALPPLLSQTGVYGDTTNRIPAAGLIPYALNAPYWTEGAVCSGYLAVPNTSGTITPDEQVRLKPAGAWTFPAGTVFVKNFDLIVDETNPQAPRHRLETQILVRDTQGGVYGVTYKWRPDNSDADLLTTGLNEDIIVTNATGVSTRTWYYASPSDCLTCHSHVAGYVLGVNTRQLNRSFTYPATGVTDNQIRTLNRLGLFSPAINEGVIANYSKLSPLTDATASLEERARSYLDANCAQCHRPGGVGNYDASYDTRLKNQRIVNAPAAFPLLGHDNADIVRPKDVRHSVLWLRIGSTEPTVKMPPLAHTLIDTNAVNVVRDWINSLPAPASDF
jgi:PA14 domain/Chitobiase/beta-hexosaminidase C-terminal domain/Bacterial Ig domain